MHRPTPLPVDPFLPAIREALRAHRRAVVVAPPGAGKSTRIPPGLLEAGPLILLQPRRVAARALARRIADEQGMVLGREVGWQVRFEKRFEAGTRLLVATEGILTARLREDPLLSGFATVVLDEFHERSIHADIALALARQAAAARDDLRLLVMSATLDAGRVAAWLGEDGPAPVIEVPGRTFPVEVEHADGVGVAAGVERMLGACRGDVLAFLPGVREIRAARDELAGRAEAEVHMLYGALDADEQDAALAPGRRRKVILATNLAETSLTVEGVDGVVDSGLARVARFDPGVELDRLEVERIGADSAVQRAGRAGRLCPGRVLRLWDRRLTLRAHREPEIARIDLAGPVLDLMAWGGDPTRFEWFEAPPAAALAHALEVLEMLGARRGTPGRITELGRRLARLPLAPRLGKLFLAAGATREAARLCAWLGEGVRGPVGLRVAGGLTSRSDALGLLDRFGEAPEGVRRAARELWGLARELGAEPGEGAFEDALGRAVLAAFPDRVAKRRGESDRVLLASGHGAVLAAECTVRNHELLVALEVAARRGEEALVRLASGVEPDWLEPTSVAVEHRFEPGERVVKAAEVARYRALVLWERPVAPDPLEGGELLAREMAARVAEVLPAGLAARLAFAAIEVDWGPVLAGVCAGKTRWPGWDAAGALPYGVRGELERTAPERLALPSGRTARLEYRGDGTVLAEVKLQELFGLAETPRVGPRRVPVAFALLSPAGRPVQVTSDLASFWARGYPEVRKELRGRYPRHPWPEDPWTAVPTHRVKPRGT